MTVMSVLRIYLCLAIACALWYGGYGSSVAGDGAIDDSDDVVADLCGARETRSSE